MLLITGVTGSLGRAFLQHTKYKGRIRGLSRDEQKQSQLRNSLRPEMGIQVVVGDVRDYDKVLDATQGCDTVIHAAALKVISTGPFNADEFMKTNVNGTWNVIQASIRNGVKKLLYISTDKACEPTTFYGFTKAMGEGLCVQKNGQNPSTDISCVRYGNVEHSRGSFTNVLAKAEKGDTVAVTDPDCTRFWLTLEAAVALIDQALEEMTGGEIFVPRISSKRVGDMIPPGVNMDIVGLKRGEKAHETLIGRYDLPFTDVYAEHFVIKPWERGNCVEVVPYRSNSEAGWGTT